MIVLMFVILCTGLHTDVHALSNSRPVGLVMEVCDNAMDDDSDGLIDLNDPDCDCTVIEPVSLIPNPSFEEMNCCPSNRSQLDCAVTWIQASEPTTDYLHTCGWLGWPQFPPPLPFPDGNGVVGFRDGRVIQTNPETNWKEYAGACLLSPLLAGQEYRFEFHVGFVNPTNSPPINITFFGTEDCANLPFGVGNEAFGCPTNGPGWQRLGSVTVSGFEWVQSQITVTPSSDIAAIVIGPQCAATTASVSTYYFFDNLVLADQRSFDFRIRASAHPCSDEIELSIPSESGLRYQWYKDGIALVGDTSAVLRTLRGEGDYQVRLTSNSGICNITRVYAYRIPLFSEQLEQSICEGDAFQFGAEMLTLPGSYIDTFQTKDGCDSVVTLDLDVIGLQTDSAYAKIFEGETYRLGSFKIKEEGVHDVVLQSSLGCDSLVRLELVYYRVYFPNIFSPNGDGVNDVYSPLGGSDLVRIHRLQIFDRWGALVYSGHDLVAEDGWDGTHGGEQAALGVFTFLVELEMDDGVLRQFAGDVMLVR